MSVTSLPPPPPSPTVSHRAASINYAELLQNSPWVTSYDYAGWLEKKNTSWFGGNSLLFKIWRKKWVSLHGFEFVYMDKEPTAANMKHISMKRITLNEQTLIIEASATTSTITSSTTATKTTEGMEPETIRNGFMIYPNGPYEQQQSNIWHFRASCEEEKSNWLVKLRQIIAIAKWFAEHPKIRVLGVGGQGIVYELFHKATNQSFAMKEITISTEAEKILVAKEAKLLRNITLSITHPNIIRIEKIFQIGDKFFLVFPLCSGGELYEAVIKRGHFTEYDAASLLRDLISGLAELHHHGILHLDIKPENILFETKETTAKIKITDFGLSKIFSNPLEDLEGDAETMVRSDDENVTAKTSVASDCTAGATGIAAVNQKENKPMLEQPSPVVKEKASMKPPTIEELEELKRKFIRQGIYDKGNIKGTYGYMAPEIILAGYQSAAADVFAAGVICYILLSGHPPFATKSIRESFMRTVSGVYKIDGHEWDIISDEAKDLVKRMLDTNPYTRITTKDILEHPWIKQLDEDDSVPDTVSQVKNEVDSNTTDIVREQTRISADIPPAGGVVHDEVAVAALKSTSTPSRVEISVRGRRSSTSDRNTVNLHQPGGGLAAHVQQMRTEKIARTMTRLMTVSSRGGRHSRLADAFLEPAKSVPASENSSATKSGKDGQDVGEEADPNHVLYQEMFDNVKGTHKAISAIIAAFGGSSAGRISIAQFALLHKQLSPNRTVKDAPSAVRSMSNFGPWGYGGINILNFIDRDRDGYITAEDIITAHAMIMQRSELFLRAVFGVYVDAVFYPGCKANFMLALRSLQQRAVGPADAKTSATSAQDTGMSGEGEGIAGIKEQVRAMFEHDPDAPDEDESQYFIPPEKLDAEYVIEPPKCITGKHVARIFERMGYKGENGYKVFEILCDALARIAARPTGERIDDASTTAARVEHMHLNGDDNDAELGRSSDASNDAKFVKSSRQMDVHDFISACQIDDILVQVLTRNTSAGWASLIRKTKSELEIHK